MTEITKLTVNKQVLGQIAMHHAFSVRVNNNGIPSNAQGRQIIPAGTPLGGADFLQNPEAILNVSNDGNAKGITEYPVDVTDGLANVALIDSGYIDETKIEGVTITDAAKQAVAPKVVFYRPGTNNY